MIKIIKTNLGSSVIDSVAYVDKRQEGFRATLLVKFKNGKIYHYKGVPMCDILAFLEVNSAGKHYNREIKNHYDGAEVSMDIEQLADMLAAKKEI